MEDISKRLEETSAACAKALEAWHKDKKDRETRGALQESVHELRKVASRIEIDVAVSERDEMTQKPIPIPSHRDSNKHRGNKNDDRGNRAPKGDGNKPSRKGPPPKKAAGGNEA